MFTIQVILPIKVNYYAMANAEKGQTDKNLWYIVIAFP